MYQVGTEGGFLPAVAITTTRRQFRIGSRTTPPVDTALPNGPFNLLLAPAERADIVIDFNGVKADTTFILYNDRPAPFPGGDPRNNYFTGDGDQTKIWRTHPTPSPAMVLNTPDTAESYRYLRLRR